MASAPTRVVRSTSVGFEQLFLDEDGNPLVPSDPVAYPAVSIVSPDEEVIQTGVATSLGEGRWRFVWYVPADAQLSTGDKQWHISWFLITASGRQVEQQSDFVVIDNVLARPDERQYTNLTLLGSSERVQIKFKHRPVALGLTLQPSITNVPILVPAADIHEVVEDGYYTFYADTPVFTQPQCVLVIWQSRETTASQAQTNIQQVRVPEMFFWWLQPDMRMFLDKIQKKVGHVQAYSDSDMYGYLLRGVDLINSTNPISSWTLGMFPTGFGFPSYLILASAWWALQAQYLSEAELAFSFSGQTVTLEVDRTGYYADALSRIREYLDNNLQDTKRNMLRRSSVGAIATRPYDFGLTSLVARVQTVNGGASQILPLMSTLGLL